MGFNIGLVYVYTSGMDEELDGCYGWLWDIWKDGLYIFIELSERS